MSLPDVDMHWVEGLDRFAALDRKLQILLQLRYRELTAPPAFRDVEFRSFSQNGEDGILLYLFTLLGAPHRTAVEICAGDGLQCNAANLIINHGWKGLLFDGNAQLLAGGRRVYARLADTNIHPPALVPAWITAKNVNDYITREGWGGEIDLLSLDLDGNDYWIWQAIDAVRPRVVVLEFSGAWPPDRAVSVPYDPDFRLDFSRTPYYCGASLAAFVSLGRTKSYRLVGTVRNRINAFFVRNDLIHPLLPEVSAADCLAGLLFQPEEKWASDQRWVEV